MKKLLLGVAAIATMALAAPAFAHDEDDQFTVDSYSSLVQMDQHIREGIQHGMSDGSLTRREARYFYRQLQDIRYLAQSEEQNDEFDPDEINARLRILHDRLHEAHDQGHARLNSDWNYSYSGRQSYYPGYYGR